MRYEILGVVRIVDGDKCSSISSQKAALLLVSLLSNPDQVVTTEQLKAEIWRDSPPSRAASGIHSYVYRLRKTLDKPGEPSSRILGFPQGYSLRLGTDELDAALFLRDAESGRAHFNNLDYALASSSFTAALANWRGPVSWGDAAGPVVKPFFTYLTETRLESTELLIDAQLALGLHGELVGQLYTLTAEYPLREAFCRQLMLALYRSGQRTAALAAYDAMRRILRDEHGLDPCQPVQRIRQQILVADERLDTLQPCLV